MSVTFVLTVLPTSARCASFLDRRHATTHFIKNIVGTRASGKAWCGVVLLIWVLIPVFVVLKLDGVLIVEQLSKLPQLTKLLCALSMLCHHPRHCRLELGNHVGAAVVGIRRDWLRRVLQPDSR